MSSRYADVIVDITHEKLDRTFLYRIPEELEQSVAPGSRVRIPFGNGNRTITGYVLQTSPKADFDESRIKDICAVEEDAANVESHLIALAAWMRRTYGSTMIQALKTVLPAKSRAKGKEVRTIALAKPEEEAKEQLELFRRKHFRARSRLLEALLAEPEMPYKKAAGELKIAPDTIHSLEKQGILKILETRTLRNPVKVSCGEQMTYQLSRSQQEVLEGIAGEWNTGQKRTCLLLGVTGSGKTLVYMELIADTLKRGQQAIVLIPEIALTRQNVERFCARFGDGVTVMHSRMNPSEKADQMERARNGEVKIMIGPRSALFTPFPNLGLIIMDEEHETSYQSEVTPRYHARETAIELARLSGARVLLGSATPSMESYYRCTIGEYALFRLDVRFGRAKLPGVWIADMREELKQGNRSILSRRLKDEMEERLEKGEQTMLFLNRRGYAGFLSCRSCGHVMKCPHCDVSLTAHNNGMLVCHYCGYERGQVVHCPKCGSPYIGGFRAGTQQIEQIVRKTFPGIRTLRMDADTTKNKDGHERILSAFAAKDADVLIGTQMIVKGHDFPDVTLVGILAADLSLNADNYRAGERTYSLLAQAIGRAGRGKKPGMAVIQTYNPEHYSIEAAARQDYEAFFSEELKYRKICGYPPASNLMAIHAACAEEGYLSEAMEYIRRYLVRVMTSDSVSLIGPAKESVAKINDLYRMVIYVKSPNREALFRMREKLEQYIEINKGFAPVYIQFDFNV